MHVILSNYRSGSLTFAKDYAKDLSLPFLGDPFGVHSPNQTLCDQISSAIEQHRALPAGVIKLYPSDLSHNPELLNKICERAETLQVISKKSFDSVLISYVCAERLLTVLDIKFDQPFTIQHTFTIPKSVYNHSFYLILQNTIDLIKTYHQHKNKTVLRWYEDIFELHSRTHRPVLLQNELPPTNICIQQMFDSFVPKL